MFYTILTVIFGTTALFFWFYLCYMLVRDDIRNEKERKLKQGKDHDNYWVFMDDIILLNYWTS